MERRTSIVAVAIAAVVSVMSNCGCSNEVEVSTADWRTIQGDSLSLKLPGSFASYDNPSGSLWVVSSVAMFVPVGWTPEPDFDGEHAGAWTRPNLFREFIDNHSGGGTTIQEVLYASGEVGADGREPLVLAVWTPLDETTSVKDFVYQQSGGVSAWATGWVHVEIEIEEASKDSARLRVSAPFSQVELDKWVEYWVFERVGKLLYCVMYRASEAGMEELGPVYLASAKTIEIQDQ